MITFTELSKEFGHFLTEIIYPMENSSYSIKQGLS